MRLSIMIQGPPKTAHDLTSLRAEEQVGGRDNPICL